MSPCPPEPVLVQSSPIDRALLAIAAAAAVITAFLTAHVYFTPSGALPNTLGFVIPWYLILAIGALCTGLILTSPLTLARFHRRHRDPEIFDWVVRGLSDELPRAFPLQLHYGDRVVVECRSAGGYFNSALAGPRAKARLLRKWDRFATRIPRGISANSHEMHAPRDGLWYFVIRTGGTVSGGASGAFVSVSIYHAVS